jgi:hypothetical protein
MNKDLKDLEIKYERVVLPAAIMLQHQLPSEVVTNLNNYLNHLRSEKHRPSAGKFLVGQIHKGEQLDMDFKNDLLIGFVNIVENLATAYLRHFVEATQSPLRPKRIAIDKLWSVHSYEGDYNPIHDHMTKTQMGISFTCWTKIPEQIEQTNPDNKSAVLYESSGAIDGYLNFTYGLTQISDPETLRPPQARFIKPEVGKLLMFPSWMQHCVYPFRGEGERRTVAGNLNCFELNKEELEEMKKNAGI